MWLALLDADDEVIMDLWERILWRIRLPLRWAFGLGFALFLFLLMKALQPTRLDFDQIMTILVVGGGSLYFTWRGIRALEASMPFRRRKVAREILREDPSLSASGSRKEIIPFLLGSDLEQLRLYSWAPRLEIFLDLLLKGIFSSPAPPSRCQKAMIQCLNLLQGGRVYWTNGRGTHPGDLQAHSGMSLRDEEILQYLLVVLILLSALFRLHLARWGPPSAPFTRRAVGRLRRTWLPFCLLVPTARAFPPPFPGGMEQARPRGAVEKGGDLEHALASWIFQGDGTRIDPLVRSFLQDV
jgi:hypothetical protein